MFNKKYYKRAKNLDALPALEYLYWESTDRTESHSGNITDEVIVATKYLNPSDPTVFNFNVDVTVLPSKATITFYFDVESGYSFSVDWGDGSIETYDGTGEDQTVDHTYSSVALYSVKIAIHNSSSLIKIDYANDTNLYATIPNLDNLINLETVEFPFSNISTLPSFSACTNLKRLVLNDNSLSGTLNSSIADCLNLESLHVYNNSLSGTFPTLSASNLTYINARNNQFTAYTPGTLSPDLYYMNFKDNSLTTTYLDLIAAAVASGVSGRPTNGLIDLSGTNGKVSSAGQANLAAIKLARPAWTVAYNYDF